MELPKDPQMLLSFVNTALRDEFESLIDLAFYYDADPYEIEAKLASIGYRYDETLNRFL
jgi:hypothetical protein